MAMFAVSGAAIAKPCAPQVEQTVPGLSTMSLANAVGVLSYCKDNRLLSDESVSALVDALSRTADVSSEDYIVGSSGQVLGDAGKNFSIFRAPAELQSQACNAVLLRARSFAH
jgi:hypothetical protein